MKRKALAAEFELVRLIAVGAAMLLVTFLIIGHSRAAFSGTTVNSGNFASAGSVTLTDNDAAAAMFNVSGLAPLQSAVRCIQVDYTGSLDPSAVKLYKSAVSGTGLEAYLDATIEIGTWSGAAPAFPSCTNFSPSSTIFPTAALSSLFSARTNYGNGLTAWDPAGAETRVFRITLALQDNNLAQGLNTTFDLTWEVQS